MNKNPLSDMIQFLLLVFYMCCLRNLFYYKVMRIFSFSKFYYFTFAYGYAIHTELTHFFTNGVRQTSKYIVSIGIPNLSSIIFSEKNYCSLLHCDVTDIKHYTDRDLWLLKHYILKFLFFSTNSGKNIGIYGWGGK